MAKLTLADVVSSGGLKPIRSLQVDSRKIGEGDLFFALPGAKVDGHAYLEQVARQGAVGAVVSKTYAGSDYGLSLFGVDDVLHTLQVAAQHFFANRRPEVVCGVTGSVGKTTTKEFLHTFLSQQKKVMVSPGNANSQIGLPLSLFNHLEGDEEVATLEMGMTGVGQISRLVEIAPPDIALITTVQLVHAGSFASIEDIARTKAEIFSSSRTKKGFIPYDLPAKAEISKRIPMETFSTIHPEADFFLEMEGDCAVVSERGERFALGNFCLPGSHNRHNLLAALVVARACGLSWSELAASIPLLALPDRRLQRIEKGGVTLINDSYNACEASVKGALESLASMCPGATRHIAVLGPVPELGRFCEACHEAIGRYALDYLDLLFCLGKECLPMVQEWRAKGREVYYFEDKAALTAVVRELLRPGDLVLLKGKNPTQLWTLVEELFP